MTDRPIRRRFQLRGRDEHDLARRIDTFRAAVHARQGTILEVDWTVGTAIASILYQVRCPPQLEHLDG